MAIRVKKVSLVLCLTGALAGCGTALSCGHEFGAPPERALWCSPIGDLPKLLFSRGQDIQPPADTVQCVETLGEPDCYKVAAGGT